MCPQNFERGSELPPLTSQPRVGPKKLANPQPAGVGKTVGPGGPSPHGGGLWGVSPPQNQKRGRVAPISTPTTSGAQNAGKPSAHGGGQNGGPGGQSPHGGGLWGVSPHKTKGGSKLPALAHPPRVGPKKLANPQPAGVGKQGGPGGRSPLAVGIPPKTPQETSQAVRPHLRPAPFVLPTPACYN